jgi:hypothetical protein
MQTLQSNFRPATFAILLCFAQYIQFRCEIVFGMAYHCGALEVFRNGMNSRRVVVTIAVLPDSHDRHSRPELMPWPFRYRNYRRAAVQSRSV